MMIIKIATKAFQIIGTFAFGNSLVDKITIQILAVKKKNYKNINLCDLIIVSDTN